MSYNTELSNMSYTNKDFNSIYVELLEYAKKLSYRWDPTCSDESDPGVVLLKLAAIIGDKDSYNIDKNILELMPASVTQLAAARQLFEQCGYSMRYYRAAQGDVNITIKKDLGDDLEEQEQDVVYSYTVPQFTMFTDTDSSIIYTTTEPVSIQGRSEGSVSVIEGTVNQYTVNNDPLITMQNLDSNNRLYFTESNIAENGIFITTVDSTKPNVTNYEDWKCVDNLQIQPKGTLCYKFGITIDSSVCYIEFPQDIESILGEGLNISYILTNGSTGNISAGKLRQFYVDTKFTRTISGTNATEVNADPEVITIKNLLPILNGQDPESIDDAYKNYKRVRDTFNTLVSLKDYSDYLVTSETASNGFVCDRTNDIQRSYKILTTENGSTYVKTVVELADPLYKKVDGVEVQIPQPSMNAFQLCAYAFEYVPAINSSEQLKQSFTLTDLSKSSSYIYHNTIYKNPSDNNVESLQHDFIGFEDERILLLKNKYPITVNIVPKYPLSDIEKFQVLLNAEKAISSVLNSTQMTFGQAVSAEVVQDAILNCDERIKTLIDFTSPKYETYAVYQTEEKGVGKVFKELRIDNDSDDAGYQIKSDVNTSNFETTPLFTRSTGGDFYKVKANDSFKPNEVYYTYTPNLSKLWNKFRVEIFAKNVLAGITPLYTDNNIYTVGVTQDGGNEYEAVKKISTNVDIICSSQDNVYRSEALRDNENILLTCPNLEDENNYSSYVKVLYRLNNGIDDNLQSGDAYELKTQPEDANNPDAGNDYIIFFWKSSNDAVDYDYVKYDSTEDSPAKFISPSSLNLPYKQDLTTSTYYNYEMIKKEDIHQYFSNIKAGKGSTRYLQNSAYTFAINKDGTMITDPTTYVSECLVNSKRFQVLTGNQIIYTKNVKTRKLNNAKDGFKYFSWILNTSSGGTYKFPRGIYTLDKGEYFLYTNDDKTTLYMLGEGTEIDCSEVPENINLSVNVFDYDKILVEGIEYINWVTIPRSDTKLITATEQQRIQIGPKNKIELRPITQLSYKGDVKLLYNFTSEPEENQPKKLTKDELIVFFWKETPDSSDYNYMCYGEGTTISCNGISLPRDQTFGDETPGKVLLTLADTFNKYGRHFGGSSASLEPDNFVDMYLKNTEIGQSREISVSVPFIVIDSKEAKPLKNYAISYVDNEGNITDVPEMNSSEVYWSAKSILNLNMSNQYPQKLESTQSLTLESDQSLTQDGDKIVTLTGSDTEPLYVQCTEKLNRVGGQNIDLAAMFGKQKIVGFRSYTILPQDRAQTDPISSTTVVTVKTNEEVDNAGQGPQKISIKISYPGSYLLQFIPSISELEVVPPALDDNCKQLSNLVYKITVSGTFTADFTIDNPPTESGATITIPALYRYSDKLIKDITHNRSDTDTTEPSLGDFEEAVLEKMKELDSKNQFDYTYKPRNPILNPLVATAFLKKDHFYNKYTICEWDANTEETLTVHDVIR